MPPIKRFIAACALAMSAAAPMHSSAQSTVERDPATSTQTAAMTNGEIRKIDLAVGKVTIKHREIKHLDMPGMTMVFTAKDKALLANLKVGDKVSFMVANESGTLVVTDIQPAR